mmetsp:Transcript_42076/g.138488  ORF Transcript_42076/g.138488 Transcript_42076/m.138488 type:complete len:242 (-) Transcript_42076:222-947(-)
MAPSRASPPTSCFATRTCPPRRRRCCRHTSPGRTSCGPPPPPPPCCPSPLPSTRSLPTRSRTTPSSLQRTWARRRGSRSLAPAGPRASCPWPQPPPGPRAISTCTARRGPTRPPLLPDATPSRFSSRRHRCRSAPPRRRPRRCPTCGRRRGGRLSSSGWPACLAWQAGSRAFATSPSSRRLGGGASTASLAAPCLASPPASTSSPSSGPARATRGCATCTLPAPPRGQATACRWSCAAPGR